MGRQVVPYSGLDLLECEFDLVLLGGKSLQPCRQGGVLSLFCTAFLQRGNVFLTFYLAFRTLYDYRIFVRCVLL